MQWRLVSWIPRRLILWCLARAMAEYEVEYQSDSFGRVAYWRVFDYAIWKTFGKDISFDEWSNSK